MANGLVSDLLCPSAILPAFYWVQGQLQHRDQVGGTQGAFLDKWRTGV